MAELKTKKNDADVMEFLNAVEHDKRREDSFKALDLMKSITGEEPSMWGDSIVGFGSYHYKYASGREGDWFKAGFSPRKQALSLYLNACFGGREELVGKLGKVKQGAGCIYVKKLEDIDLGVLEQLIRQSCDSLSESD
jgi:hypothetical protein